MTISRLSCPTASAPSAVSAVNTSPQLRPRVLVSPVRCCTNSCKGTSLQSTGCGSDGLHEGHANGALALVGSNRPDSRERYAAKTTSISRRATARDMAGSRASRTHARKALSMLR